ncbi:MAG: hypothetical protein PVF58_09250 [Candidatus Methanofastidiosia archaeon]
MNRKKIGIAVTGVVVVSLVLFSTVGSLVGNTPLYIFRMEQASSEMSFLPTIAKGFTYITENGCTLNHAVEGCCGIVPLDMKSERATECDETCANTCPATCETCPSTCDYTCPQTCDDPTCPSTCEDTCGNTCEYTCDDPTCPSTCEFTCRYTCDKPCQP